jgi:hypothetical protein
MAPLRAVRRPRRSRLHPDTRVAGAVRDLRRRSASPPEICEARLDLAARYLSGEFDVGWRVRVTDAPRGLSYLGEYGTITALDGEGNATIRFERRDLADTVDPTHWLVVGASALPWP